MASGLRVRSAVDDPSGYTIAESIHSQVSGLQQSVTSVQTANNLLNVADGALNSITLILQRIRSLVVEANSDLNSENDLEHIQTEINQLLDEINTISTNTNFNGLKLFNGQFETGLVSSNNPANFGIITSVTPPFPNPGTGNTGSNIAVNGSGSGTATPFIQVQPLTVGSFIPTLTVWSIVSASNNMIDPDTGIDIGPGVLLQEVAYSTDGSQFGPTPLYTDYTALNVNAGSFSAPIIAPSNLYPPTFGSGQLIYNVTINNLSFADVGAQAAFITQNPTLPPVGGNALTINSGGDEGKTVSVSIPLLNTDVLDIADINVLDPTTSNLQFIAGTPTTVVQGVSESNNIPASYAEIKVDAALQQIETYAAQIGAQTVALNIDVQNGGTTIVNLTASESSIRDTNVGQTATDFTKQQIMVDVATSVLSQIEVSASQLTALLLNSFAALPAVQATAGTGVTA